MSELTKELVRDTVTIIDVVQGDPHHGYELRLGTLREGRNASRYLVEDAEERNKLIRYDINEAIDEARQWMKKQPHYRRIRIDCTIE